MSTQGFFLFEVIFVQYWNVKTIYGSYEPSRNRAGRNDYLESILGLIKSLKIPSQYCNMEKGGEKYNSRLELTSSGHGQCHVTTAPL